MGVYVGLDCGGSSSRVLAVDSAGTVLYQGQSGAANLVSTPDGRLRRNLQNATRGCPRADFVCGCFAGLVSEEVRHRGIERLRELFPDARLRAEPDYTAALYASPEGTDVCVIAGTGSLVCSRYEDRIVKSGGRGYLLGDVGSGFHYGRDALLHFLQAPAKASPTLREEILKLFGSEEESEIVPIVYRASPPSTLLAKLLKALAADVRSGEPYALESVKRHTADLAGVVAMHVSRYLSDQETLRVSLAGGVWKCGPPFLDHFEQALRRELPTKVVEAGRVTRPPIYGAVELAKEMSFGNGK